MDLLRIVYYVLILVSGSIGLVSGDARIVGGETTTIEKHPWQVSIQIFGLHSCGGAIISPSVVLTAAHCIDEILVDGYQVVVGTTDLSKPNTRVLVNESIVHDLYDTDTLDYDIAILKLGEQLKFTNQIKPIRLPEQGYVVPNATPLVTSGWGLTEADASDFSDVLREVQINAIAWEECNRKLSSVGLFTERMICAGVVGGGKDTCQGDSGGAVEQNGTLIGIVSWGKECGAADYPGVYTHVSYFRSWIRDHSGV